LDFDGGRFARDGPVLAFAERYGESNLLFIGTEFGVFFSIDAGQHWVRLKGGLADNWRCGTW